MRDCKDSYLNFVVNSQALPVNCCGEAAVEEADCETSCHSYVTPS
jgi:hypothetical protein